MLALKTPKTESPLDGLVCRCLQDDVGEGLRFLLKVETTTSSLLNALGKVLV